MKHTKQFIESEKGRAWIRSVLQQHSHKRKWRRVGRLGRILKTNIIHEGYKLLRKK